jgi:hypothetical protein
VPHAGNLNNFAFVIHAVNNPVRSENNLADVRDTMLWNDAAHFGLLLQEIDLRDESKGKRLGALRVVTGDESNDAAQVSA